MAENWMTGFYWQQDLRSYYMNGLLNASLRPGVYNSDIAIFASEEKNAETGVCAGLNLFIKKGTTLAFSNGYSLKNSRVERDLDNVGSYLIKSYASKDIVVNLLDISLDDRSGNPKRAILGGGGTNEAEEYYVVAYIKYAESTTLNISEPQFTCIVKNPEFVDGNSSAVYSRYFSSDGVNGGEEQANFYLPDGQFALGAQDAYIGYLILGVVTPAKEQKSYLGSSGSKWENSQCPSLWNASHSFVGRGFPDYRYPYTSDSSDMTPDLFIKTKEGVEKHIYNGVILDLREAVLNGKILGNTVNLSGVYGWGNQNLPNDALKGEVKEYENSELEKSGIGLHVICDMLYLSSKLSCSEMSTSLKEVVSEKESYTLKDFSWIGDLTSGGSFEISSSSVQGNFCSKDARNTDSNNLMSALTKGVIPLDVCKVNQSRLLDFIKNKNILGPVINEIRHTLNDAREDTILPVALIFRAFEVSSEGAVTFKDNFSSGTGFNPANLLSFFDLQYKAHKINVLNIKTDSVYSVLPTLE